MSLKRFTIDGKAVLELNHVAFRRDGRIVAQCKMGADVNEMENGMLMAVDEVTRTVNFPAAANTGLIALHYSTEHLYDERHPELNHFSLKKGSFLPRLCYLAAGDKFTTNCIAYDDQEFANDAAVKAAIKACGTTALYGVPCANGAIKLTANSGNVPTGSVVLQVVAETTIPNGDYAAKFVALN